jgi:hypothetical protein
MKSELSLSNNRASELAASQRARLARAREAYGVPRIVEATGVSENTLWKAIAGGRLYNGSWAAIERGLNELERLPR